MFDALDEIKEQGKALRYLVQYYNTEPGKKSLDEAAKILREAPDKPVLITGMGSSLFAGRILNSELSRKGLISQRTATDELLDMSFPWLRYRSVLISQSGRSVELVDLLHQLPQVGDQSLVVTNNLESPLAKAGKKSLPMCAGSEQMSATKTYTNTVALLAKLGEKINGMTNQERLDSEILSAADQIDELVAKYQCIHFDMPVNFVTSSVYPLLSVAEQAAMLFKEMAQEPAEAKSLRDFRHGNQEMCYSKPGIVLITEQMDAYQKNYLEKISQAGPKIFVLSGDQCPANWKHLNLNCRGLHFLLVATVAVELWAYNLAISKKLRPGHFFVGAKVIE